MAILTAALLACTRLPPEWDGAGSAAAFSQSECTGDVSELERGRRERVDIRPAAGGRLLFAYHHARFRCAQPVTAYVRKRGAAIDVLVQPVDMSPSSVAKCECLYDIAFEVPGLPAGTYDVTLHRRGDDRHSPNDPVRVASERVIVTK